MNLITLTLMPNELNMVVRALQQIPNKTAFVLSSKILGQANPQIAAQKQVAAAVAAKK